MASKAETLLESYRQKRDFARTSEPSGGAASAEGLAFVVQKHDATRLHYDFRVEWEGVLKSWAVTRGPSLDPADKRLAVRTEDHPMDYGDFEGTIPAGEYGGGTVMVWDRGTWEPEGDAERGLADGNLKMILHGEKMRGRWALIRMKPRPKEKRENWLLIKEKDGEVRIGEDFLAADRSAKTGRDMAAIAAGDETWKRPTGKKAPKVVPVTHKAAPHKKARDPKASDGETPSPRRRSGRADAMPAFRPLQLARLVDEAPAGDDWLHEVKYDGYRVLIAIGDGRTRLYTRNELDWTDRFGRLPEAALALGCRSALIDGEVVAFDKDGRSDFSSLQAALKEGGELSCFCFDLLHLDGEDLTGEPLMTRKEKLRALVGAAEGTPLQYSDHVRGHGPKVFAGICKAGEEGIVSKRADAPYAGDRNGDWQKTKCTRRQEFVIGGFASSDKKGRAFASLLVGVREGDGLRYCGRVGTGFDDETMQDLAARFERLARKTSPFDAPLPGPIRRTARFVTPDLVAEVDFAEFTADGQIRHGAFQGLREDKPADEVVDETKADTSDDDGAASSVGAKRSRSKDGGSKPAKPTKGEAPANGGETAGRREEEGDDPIEIAGVRLTHPGRVLFEDLHLTKGDLGRYYEIVAPRLLAHAGERPLSILRCPGGPSAQRFFQKHAGEGFPEALGSVEVEEKRGENATYMSLADAGSLIAAVQMGAVEFHVWGAHNASQDRPDRLVFDLDPDEALGFADVRSAAVLMRDALDTLGLRSWPMVTGGKGVHVVVPLDRRRDVEGVAAFARGLANRVAASDPDRFVAVMSKAKREGRIFIDWMRNGRAQTAIAPYSTRARAGCPVAVPVSWEELETLDRANGFTPDRVIERLGEPDPWADYGTVRQSVTKAMIAAVADAD
ncbi:DNA ligase D [Aureimonas pseudogalii]|uniref:DNA ligase (ATP) n=1 Tax=Aureimonas pseudogalii TaxID=1744844 RepID=A0A7W6E935_9HYPH|nr:DNA ligase D [Aureimonas pseudogalii]MBB3996534.1 bifunctional non-homologous end joining protein LigD [Aureimonas pseudogalii]